ncbi:fimbrial protein [Enterobacter kobei]|uniref:fimbrial protein n=1 Tax=Enterobacter kobei TaxID=208224 RepID=UPI00300CFFBB
MKKNTVILICSIFTSILTGSVNAAYTESCVDVTSFKDDLGDKTILSPSQKPVPSQIGTVYEGTTNYTVFRFKNPACSEVNGVSSWGLTKNTSTGMTYSSPDGELPVYSLGVKGLGFAVAIADPNGPYQPMTDNPTLPLYKSASRPGAGKSIGARYNIYILATGVLANGTYPIQGQDIGFICISSSQTTNTKDLCTTISINPFNIIAKGGSCYFTPSSESMVIKMPSASMSDFSGVNSEARQGVSFSIQTACSAGVSLYATMTDANKPDNLGSVLSPSLQSTAEGVGIQVYYNGSSKPLLFGPESSVAGNINQFFIGGSPNSKVTAYNLQFLAKYVQISNQMSPGRVSANAIVTFSYQ